MAEKRSARVRKVQNYALIDEGSDSEFFDDEPIKPQKNQKINHGIDDNWHADSEEEAKPAPKSVKPKKQVKEKSVKQRKTMIQAEHVNIAEIKPISSKNTRVNSHQTVAKISVIAPSTIPVSNISPRTVSTPPNMTSPSPSSKLNFPVTPSGGLRIGLSRNQKLTPLHSNLRIA